MIPLARGEGVRLTLFNRSFRKRLQVSAVRVGADDSVVSLLPRVGQDREGRMPLREWSWPPRGEGCLQLAEVGGLETLKLFATTDRLLDFRPLERSTVPAKRGGLDDLVAVALTAPRTRGAEAPVHRRTSLAVPRGFHKTIQFRVSAHSSR